MKVRVVREAATFKQDIEKAENAIKEIILFSMPFFVAYLVKVMIL